MERKPYQAGGFEMVTAFEIHVWHFWSFVFVTFKQQHHSSVCQII